MTRAERSQPADQPVSGPAAGRAAGEVAGATNEAANGAADTGRLAALEAENRLLRAELERSRRTLESATEYGLITLDPEGRIASWNAGARNVLGYVEAEILGHSGDLFFTPEDRAGGVFLAELGRALDRGRAENERWHLRKDGSRFWASGVMLPLLDEEGRPDGFLNILRDGSAAKAALERQALVQAELTHRVKNTMSLVHAVAEQSQRYAVTPQAFQEAFGSRLRALARSHDMLFRSGWDGAPIREVIERALEPYAGPPGRVALEGMPIRLSSAVAVSLSLVFHELATNAAKHGALSVPVGGVQVTWTRRRGESGMQLLEVVWREHDGPPVRPPARQGFGSRLLARSLQHEFGCLVQHDFLPAGVECRICLPLTATVLGA